ncbi:MAG: LPS export ABC transporter periplasmic protein LptC [Flavobacteriaceae bacterium]
MSSIPGNNFKTIAIGFSMAILFFGCQDNYKRIGEEAEKKVIPQGIAKNFKLTYTETPEKMNSEDIQESNIIAVLSSPLSEDYNNQEFKYRTFPHGLLVESYDEQHNKSTIKADYGIIYSMTNVLDLRGDVVIETHDGKKLETPQLYWDRGNDWIFTQQKFKFTNPEDGTVMDGEGMDFNTEFSYFNAHKTFGLMTIKEDPS